MNKGKNTAKGITLIALVITIIVMLILVAVTISMALNGGLFGYAKDATTQTKSKMEAESQLSTGRIKIGDVWYDSPQDYADDKPSADQTDGGSGSSTGGGTQNPTQGYVWEKYSFNITTQFQTATPSEVGDAYDFLTYNNGSIAYNQDKTINSYAKINFANNTVYLDQMWTGNLKEYYCGQYKNYPFVVSCSTNSGSYYETSIKYTYSEIAHNITGQCNITYCSALPVKKFLIGTYNKLVTLSQGSYKYGEVQSTDQTAYPQNGFKDGYWYVLKQS